MWWDERFASFDGAVIESDSQAKLPSRQQLSASIALDSAYVRCAFYVNQASILNQRYVPLARHVPSFSFSCRTLVQEAFDRRPEWTVNRTELTAADAAESSGSDDSLFYWGEYEGVDWEKVHSGELQTRLHRIGQLRPSRASTQLRASCHGHRVIQGTNYVACPYVS